MNTKTATSRTTSEREIVITRLVSAPRELVFEVWTDPKHLAHWWGPRGFTDTTQEISVKPGGIWRHVMHGPDGTDYQNWTKYEEVVKPERLVYMHGGNKVGGQASDEVAFRATVTFEAKGNKTLVTMHSVFATAEARNHVIREYKAVEGGIQTLDKLEEHLAMLAVPKEFVIARSFDAPRELVWKVFTEPEHMKNWFGPKGFTGQAAKLDFRVGGIYHYCLRSPEGLEMWGKFVYRYINAPANLHVINSFSDEQGGVTRHPMSSTWPLEMLTKFSFTEESGRTTITVTWVPFNATEAEIKTFNEMFGSMEQGWSGTFERLAEYLKGAR